MMPPKRSLKIRKMLDQLNSVTKTKPLILKEKTWPKYRHALKIFNTESGKKLSVRTTERGVELWLNG